LYSTSLQAYAAEEQTTSTSPVVASGDASSEPFCFLEKMTPSTPHIASTTAADLAHESCSPRSGIEKR